ncbi:MAG: hypothetical protein ACKO0Z_11250, partial [Betaproteobacteria bacterium]
LCPVADHHQGRPVAFGREEMGPDLDGLAPVVGRPVPEATLAVEVDRLRLGQRLWAVALCMGQAGPQGQENPKQPAQPGHVHRKLQRWGAGHQHAR